MSVLSKPYMHDEAAAFAHVESIIWPDGPVCPHCGKQHLHRYAAEFDFRYNHRAAHGVDDLARADLALRRVIGTRLTYAQ